MKNYTFEQLPVVLGSIEEKLDLIQNILQTNDNNESKEDLVSIKEASIFLKLTVPTIYSKVSRQEIPVFKKGKKLYFSLAELHSWVRSGKKKTINEIHEEAKANWKKK